MQRFFALSNEDGKLEKRMQDLKEINAQVFDLLAELDPSAGTIGKGKKVSHAHILASCPSQAMYHSCLR